MHFLIIGLSPTTKNTMRIILLMKLKNICYKLQLNFIPCENFMSIYMVNTIYISQAINVFPVLIRSTVPVFSQTGNMTTTLSSISGYPFLERSMWTFPRGWFHSAEVSYYDRKIENFLAYEKHQYAVPMSLLSSNRLQQLFV